MCLSAKGIVMSELKPRPPKRHAPQTSGAVGARHVEDPPQEGRVPIVLVPLVI
jgi:hypothetical protein